MEEDGGRSWAELPADLVDDVSRRLPVVSFISMAHVCKPWRRILAEQLRSRQGLPWLVFTDHNQQEERPCFSILQWNFWYLRVPVGKYCWGSVQDWLIVVDKCGPSTIQIHFWNPFTATKIVLPTLSYDYDWYAKIILSEASPDHPNCLFLLVGRYDRRIACWTPGADSSSWLYKPDNRPASPFSDAVFCDGRFYFVTHDYNIQTLDPQDVISAMKQPYDFLTVEFHLRPHLVSFPDRPTWGSKPLRRYLVESCGEVLMVCRLFLPLAGTDRETHSFEVFKLDALQCHPMVWTKMQGLGDRVLFLGGSDSRSFSAKDLGDDVADRIFFFNDSFTFKSRNEWTPSDYEWLSSHLDTVFPPLPCCTFKDWGSFRMDTKSFVPKGSNHGIVHHFPPIWITAPIGWFFPKHVNSAKRTYKSMKTCDQQEKKEASYRPEKRKRIATIDHH